MRMLQSSYNSRPRDRYKVIELREIYDGGVTRLDEVGFPGCVIRVGIKSERCSTVMMLHLVSISTSRGSIGVV